MDKPRLLIVEDESVVVVDLASRLERMGYEVTGSAASGDEALALAGEFLPDLVLMDIRLQGAMDGVDTAQKMRDFFGLPVVFITAHAEGDTLMRAKKVEPYGYILKPFEDRELKIVIEMALYKRQTENELKQKYAQIARFNQVAVGRELRMIELKQEINGLRRAAGLPDKYRIVDEA
jgi:DNA-binding NtrC family response regulator